MLSGIICENIANSETHIFVDMCTDYQKSMSQSVFWSHILRSILLHGYHDGG